MSVKSGFIDDLPALDSEIDAAPAALPRRRRRPVLVFAGLALIATCGVGGAVLYDQADERVDVLVLARDVAYGQTLAPQDLASVRVALDPAVDSVPASDRVSMVGKPVSSDLVAGQLLTRSQTFSTPAPGKGRQLVAVALRSNQMPAQGLRRGDSVDVVTTPGEDGEVPDSPPSAISVEVLRVGEADVDGVRVVDVEAPATDGPALAARVSTGNIAIVLNPAGA